MIGACLNSRNRERRLAATLSSLVVLAAFLGCKGEQRSGAALPDSSPAASTTDSTPNISSDTTRLQAGDSSSTMRGESTAVHADTAKAVATKPPARRTTAPKPVTPKPTPRPARTDTAASDTGKAAAARSDSSAAQQSSDSAAGSQTSQATAPLRDPYHQPPLDTVPQQVYDGWKQFNLNCARCHGEDAQGTTIAPHLIVSLRPDGPINTKEIFMQTVCAGRPAKGMPSWCALGMEMSTIEEIYSYVKGRSDAKIHPGRPAVKAGG
jgi:mono/diheme cytochrome c family protein